jgi:AraC family transcriptional regulator
MRERFFESWSLERLAHQLATNRCRLATEFNEQFGCSPHDYLLAYRVHVAEQRVVETAEKFETTAAEVGFRSKKTLYEAFWRLRRLTPGEVRRRGKARRDG